MAPPLNQPNHLPQSPSLSAVQRRRRCSKAQMCFFNILHIISVFPAADVTDEKCFVRDEEICENKRFGDGINVNLRPPTEIDEAFEILATADGFGENCVKEKNDRRKNESFVAEESESAAVEEERATEHSEISHVGDQSSGIDYFNGVSEEVVVVEQRDEGYLGLLIEAAQLILGEESDKANKPPADKHVAASSTARKGAKRKQQQCWTAATEAEWYAEFEDTSPVVKSKRGRSQVLPYKYRDSVVEPLVGWMTSSSHRSIGNSPSKRRSK